AGDAEQRLVLQASFDATTQLADRPWLIARWLEVRRELEVHDWAGPTLPRGRRAHHSLRAIAVSPCPLCHPVPQRVRPYNPGRHERRLSHLDHRLSDERCRLEAAGRESRTVWADCCRGTAPGRCGGVVLVCRAPAGGRPGAWPVASAAADEGGTAGAEGGRRGLRQRH